MATRWGCPCGCVTVYEMDGETAIPQVHEVKCGLHTLVSIDDIIPTLQQWCVDNPVE